MNDLQAAIMAVMSDTNYPLTCVYDVCKKLGHPQQSSTNKYYVRVYRNMEKLVDMGAIWVARGTRDVSVYLSKEVVKGHPNGEFGGIPF